ncbi:hypothetical protein JZ751_005843 [Albula glossodonta]|uniref:GON domain-containing protein n=1 Tax=Albula glossodonta TaxID=121402 RepID=A0A8T2P5F6_9TELE|nr:hypothetical protein JZ751_005843 [Albula glossodonta]
MDWFQRAGKLSEDQCDTASRPADSQPCLLPACPRQYTWTTDQWQECNTTCGEGVRTRRVLCVGGASNPVPETLCNPASRPALFQPCHTQPCQYVWLTGAWSQCSASCGPGYQQRMVSCSEMHSSQDSHSYTPHGLPHADCPKPHPPETRCSQTCGAGVMERTVDCLTSKDLPSKSCHPIDRPESRVACQERECELSTTCREVQVKEGVRKDGEFYLRVKSRILQIYCADMQSGSPKEYVTLRSGQMDNFSEVYGYRLQNPFECPFNGSRRQDCQCRNDYPAAGYTLFHKIRLDISVMRIITTDLLFSQTPLGRAVPMGLGFMDAVGGFVGNVVPSLTPGCWSKCSDEPGTNHDKELCWGANQIHPQSLNHTHLSYGATVPSGSYWVGGGRELKTMIVL